MRLSKEESFLSAYCMEIGLIVAFVAIGIMLFWFQYEMTNPNGPVQQVISQEQTQLDQVKGNCKALGDWILKQGGNPLNLDSVVDQAKNIYMVNCK